MRLKKGLILIRKPDKVGDPKKVKVLTEDPMSEWYIRLEKEEGGTMIMPKGTIYKFFEPEGLAHQEELFEKPKTFTEKLKEKYLNVVI